MSNQKVRVWFDAAKLMKYEKRDGSEISYHMREKWNCTFSEYGYRFCLYDFDLEQLSLLLLEYAECISRYEILDKS